VGFHTFEDARPGGGLALHSDPARWDQLIEDVRPAAMLVVITSSMSRDLLAHGSAEDIWQETLACAWRARHRHRWQGTSEFRAWLFQIARNRIRDAARRLATDKRDAGRRAARFWNAGSGSSQPSSGMFPPDTLTPSRILMHAERARAMQEALATLPPELEPVVRMHLLEGLTMEVVAKRLGIGISAAWRRFRKGSELYSSRLAAWGSGASGSPRW
jgi:RNA polymerase sigma factor (sigma-70 family)